MLRFPFKLQLAPILIILSFGLQTLKAQKSTLTLTLESGALYSQYKGSESIFNGIPKSEQDDYFIGNTTGLSLQWNAFSNARQKLLNRLSFSIDAGYQMRVMEQTLHFWAGPKDQKDFDGGEEFIFSGIRSRPTHKSYEEEPYLKIQNHNEIYIRPILKGKIFTYKKVSLKMKAGVQLERRMNRRSNPYYKNISQGDVASILQLTLDNIIIDANEFEWRMATYNKLRWNYVYGLSAEIQINKKLNLRIDGNYFHSMSPIHILPEESTFNKKYNAHYRSGNTTLGLELKLGKQDVKNLPRT